MITKFKIFEHNENDPYDEEDWNDYEIVDIKSIDDVDIGDDIFTKTGELFGVVVEKQPVKDKKNLNNLNEIIPFYGDKRIIIKTPRGSLFFTSNNVKLYMYGFTVKKVKK